MERFLARPNIANIEQYRAKARQWEYARRLIARMREEQGPGELNYSKVPKQLPFQDSITVRDGADPVRTVKDRS